MSSERLVDYLEQMRRAAADARAFVEGHDKSSFLQDKRTQQAVVMSLIIIGEAAARIADRFPDFAASQPDLPWHAMRGMRNRIAHGYFELDLNWYGKPCRPHCRICSCRWKRRVWRLARGGCSRP
jgi:uncharacterized protein with HEPN domain